MKQKPNDWKWYVRDLTQEQKFAILYLVKIIAMSLLSSIEKDYMSKNLNLALCWNGYFYFNSDRSIDIIFGKKHELEKLSYEQVIQLLCSAL